MRPRPCSGVLAPSPNGRAEGSEVDASGEHVVVSALGRGEVDARDDSHTRDGVRVALLDEDVVDATTMPPGARPGRLGAHERVDSTQRVGLEPHARPEAIRALLDGAGTSNRARRD